MPTGEKLIILKDAVYLDSHNVRVAFPTLYPHLAFLQLPGIRPLCINPPLYICKAFPPVDCPPCYVSLLASLPAICWVYARHMLVVCYAHVGCMLGVYYAHVGCMLGVCCAHVGCMLCWSPSPEP